MGRHNRNAPRDRSAHPARSIERKATRPVHVRELNQRVNRCPPHDLAVTIEVSQIRGAPGMRKDPQSHPRALTISLLTLSADRCGYVARLLGGADVVTSGLGG